MWQVTHFQAMSTSTLKGIVGGDLEIGRNVSKHCPLFPLPI